MTKIVKTKSRGYITLEEFQRMQLMSWTELQAEKKRMAEFNAVIEALIKVRAKAKKVAA